MKTIDSTEAEPNISEDQLRRLSLRGIVMYASRCAERVFPLYSHRARYFWGKKKDMRALQMAIFAAEFLAEDTLVMNELDTSELLMVKTHFSSRSRVQRDPAMDLAAARALTASELAAAVAKKMNSRKMLVASAIASAASRAAYAAMKAANSQNNLEVNPEIVVTNAILVDALASLAALSGDAVSGERASKIADYEKLLSLMDDNMRYPEFGHPISHMDLGSLWRKGQPGWSFYSSAK